MKQDEIIEMARQAGFETMLCKGKILGFDRDGDYTEELEAFAKLVAAKEREACADLCHDEAWKYKVLAVDKQKVDLNNKAIACFDLSEKIRARGEA